MKLNNNKTLKKWYKENSFIQPVFNTGLFILPSTCVAENDLQLSESGSESDD